MLEKELRKKHFSTKEFLSEDKLIEVARRFGLNTADDLCAAIGDGNLTVNQVLNKQKELFFQDAQVDDIIPLNIPTQVIPHPDRDTGSLRIKGVDDVVFAYPAAAILCLVTRY